MTTGACLEAFSRPAASLGLAALLLAAVAAQQPSRPAPQSPPQFRAGVDLIQIDVSVLDRDRHPVTGLTAADFTILEDGVTHPIAAFSEVVIPGADEPPTAWMRDVAPDVRRNDEARDRRLTVIVMDDMTIPLSVEMIDNARAIGRRVVDQMGPGDLASVVFTRSNREAQDFTSDRARLLAAVDKFTVGSGDPVFNPDPNDPGDTDMMQTHQFLSSIATLRRAAELLALVPDRRKALVFISVGVPFDQAAAAEVVLIAPGGEDGADRKRAAALAIRDLNVQIKTDLNELFRHAQRANVNVYPVDPSGLGGMSSYLLRRGVDAINAMTRARHFNDFLQLVSANTGGRAFLDTNEFDAGVRQIFRENGSYYLLGYRTTNPSRNGGHRRLEVRVNRPGVEVRARSGYFAPTDAPARGSGAADTELGRALGSLLPKGDVAMQVTAAALARPGAESTSSVAIVLGLRQPAPAGTTRVNEVVDLSVNAFTPEGQARGSHRLKAELTLRPSPGDDVSYEVLSSIDLQPGRYQLRLAAESAMQRQAGSVFYDVDVPDFSRLPLSLSGVAVTRNPALPSAPRNRLADLLPLVPTTQREFERGDKVTAFARVYQTRRAPPLPVTVDAHVVDATGRVVFGAPQKLAVERFGWQPDDTSVPRPPDRSRLPVVTRPEPAPPPPAGPYAADVRLDLPVFTFSPGPHLLVVEVSNGRESARRDVRFQMR
jgi:VWFA-related protein